jgi:hypothetical protein
MLKYEIEKIELYMHNIQFCITASAGQYLTRKASIVKLFSDTIE